MYDVGIPVCLAKLLINGYSKISVFIKWNNCYSLQCLLKIGVRQGGVLSPILFNIYIVSVIKSLVLADLGCHIGWLIHVDDIILLSASVGSLQTIPLQNLTKTVLLMWHRIEYVEWRTGRWGKDLYWQRFVKRRSLKFGMKDWTSKRRWKWRCWRWWTAMCAAETYYSSNGVSGVTVHAAVSVFLVWTPMTRMNSSANVLPIICLNNKQSIYSAASAYCWTPPLGHFPSWTPLAMDI